MRVPTQHAPTHEDIVKFYNQHQRTYKQLDLLQLFQVGLPIVQDAIIVMSQEIAGSKVDVQAQPYPQENCASLWTMRRLIGTMLRMRIRQL